MNQQNRTPETVSQEQMDELAWEQLLSSEESAQMLKGMAEQASKTLEENPQELEEIK